MSKIDWERDRLKRQAKASPPEPRKGQWLDRRADKYLEKVDGKPLPKNGYSPPSKAKRPKPR